MPDLLPEFETFMDRYLECHHPELMLFSRLIGRAALDKTGCDNDVEAADGIMCWHPTESPIWRPSEEIEEVIAEHRNLFDYVATEFDLGERPV